MDMNVGAMGMIDQTSIKNVWTLMFADGRLRMDAEMQAIEVVDAIPETVIHRSQEAPQSIRFITALDLCNAAVPNDESDWFGEVRGYADVA
jgi:hypothetical protein